MAQCKTSTQSGRDPVPPRRFLALCLALCVGASSTPTPGLAQQPPQADIEAVQQLLIRLKSSDKHQSSGAAQALGSYAYAEVNQALVQAAAEELSQGDPNTFVIGNAVKSLIGLATPQDVPGLQQIKAKIEQLIATGTANRSLPYIHAEVERAIQAADQRRDADSKRLIVANRAPLAQGSLADRPLFKQTLTNALIGGQSPSAASAAKTVLAATSGFLSDELLEQLRKNEQFEIFGRDREAQQAIDTLTREKGKNPVLIGPRGAGKTIIVQKIARAILDGQIPAHAVFQNELSGAFVIETTPARISRMAKSNDNNAQAEALETYFDALLTLERELNVKIVLFIDEIHTLGPGQVEAMKPYLDSRTKAIKLIGASTSVEYQNAFKSNPAIQRRFDPIGVSEQSVEDVRKIIMAVEKPRAEKRYGFRVADEAIDAIVNNANRVYPDTSLVDAAAKMLMTLCSAEARKLGTQVARPVEITESMAYGFIQDKLGYPVNPLDVRALKKYREELLKALNEEVIGQERMVGDVADEWIRLLRNNKKGVRSVMVQGPTGVGKSHLGRELAQKVFGSKGAFLEVDANQFKEGGLSSNTFFGAPNGVSSSDKTAGMLFDYLDDPGRGKFGGVIVINEAERASTDFWEKMMEILDTGRGTGGDGKERALSRHLVVLTSNRGDSALYPRTIEDWTESEYRAHMETLTEERLKSVFKEATTGRDKFRLPDPVLARIDKYTAAEPMTPAKVRLLAAQKARKAIQQVEASFKIKIELDPGVPAEIAKASYQKGLGARPVEKKVVDLIEAAIDRYLANHDTTRGDQLQVSLTSSGQTTGIEVRGPRGAATLPIPGAAKPDLLNDQELLARLDGLDQEMKSRIFGQDEMVGRIKDAVIAHQATQGKRPLSLFMIGTTGTGKTETAKALARALYRSESRVLVLDMGKIIYEGEFNNVFGSPAGHTGSQEESVFEQFLRENPQGGVIVFDEISNMGGKDPAQKQALFKKLYSIFEEGVWRSAATNKSYDLSKYTIINTGNDLEGLLQGVSADDLRLSIWKRNKSSANVRSLLVKAGVPEAFLGRMADIILMKPLLRSEVHQITRSLLTGQTKEFREKDVDIRFEESFVQDVSNKFFTQGQGARAIRNLVEFRVKSAIAQLVIRARGAQNLKGKAVRLSIEDNQVNRTYVRPSDPERKVTLRAEVDGDGALSVVLDATEFAATVNLQTRREVLRTSYHEAGHAIVNDPSITGERVAMITVVGQDGYLGYARYEEINGRSQSTTERKVVVDMAKLLAGQTAEKLAGFQESAGWQNDLDKARSLATRYVLDWGLGENMASVPVDKNGNPKLRGAKAQQFQKEVDRVFAEAQRLAENVLRGKWGLARAVVGELYAKGEITGARFAQIESRFKQTPGLAKWMKSESSSRLVRSRSSGNRCADLWSNGR